MKDSSLIEKQSRQHILDALKHLAKYYSKNYLWLVVVGFSFLLLYAASTFALVRGLEPLLNKIVLERGGKSLWIFPIFMILCFTIRGISSYISALCFAKLGHNIIRKIQNELYHSLIYADFSYFIRTPVSRMVSFFSYELQPIRAMITETSAVLVRDSLTITALAINLIYTDWTLALFFCICLPLYTGLSVIIGKKISLYTDRLYDRISLMNNFVDESLRNVRQIKSSTTEEFQRKKAYAQFDDVYKLSFKIDKIFAIRLPISDILMGTIISILIVITSYKVLNGTSTLGTVLSFIVSGAAIYAPIRSLLNANKQIYQGTTATNRIMSVIHHKKNITDIANAPQLKVTRGTITFEHVHHTYGKGLSPAINDMSFHIPSKKTIAFVGASGAGKTTIFNLLLRFFDSDKGTISIDGQNIYHVTQQSLRNNMAVVFQDTEIFNNTVTANIAFGEDTPDMEKIYRATKTAEAEEFIEKLPEKYDTLVGDRGIKLSGGQKQRIILSRVFYKPAPILLFDEATSALDNITENTIRKALDTMRIKHTILIIAHRLSTIKKADIIFMMDKGRVIAHGTHDTLIKTCAPYKKLYAHEEKVENTSKALS